MRDLSKLTALAGQLHDIAQKREKPKGGRWYDIRNATSDHATVYLYGVIGEDFWGDGNSASDFTQELAAVTANRVDLMVNSEGGQVFEGVAIHSAIAAFPGTVTGKVTGLAASAASFILMACDRIEMAKGAKMMIHDAATGFAMASGNAQDLREFAQEVISTADLLDELSDTIAEMYADRAGGTVAQWRNTMRAETWYSSAQAVEAKLADGVIGESTTPESPAAPVETNTATDELDATALLAALKGAWDA